MNKESIFLTLILLGLVTPILCPIPAKCAWSIPNQLTSNSYVDDRYPCISGYGTKIAFNGDGEIFVVNSDGTGLTQLTYNMRSIYHPSISGDGTKIAFYSEVDGDWEIFLVTFDGSSWSSPIQLTYNTVPDISPSISGDGSKIAFSSDLNDREIFVVNSDGTGLTQLTHNNEYEYDSSPSISGDGSKIAFESDVDGDSEIFIVNSDGSGLIQLTHNTVIDEHPSISGDGSKIAFHSYVDGDWEIFVVNSDGTGLTQLTDNTAWNINPSICGDGSKIAFDSLIDGDREIFIVNSDGSALTQVTQNTVHDQTPSISGDGSKIAFESWDGDDWEIFLIGLESSSYEFELSAGWNMISFPSIPDNPSFSSIFSNVSFYQVLTWDGSSYVTPTVAGAGVGYWVLILEETTVTIENANPVTSYELELPAGWSMIGSIYGETVDADDVFPGFYQLLTWDGTSYILSTTIEPGKGYWALVLELTTITVG